MSYEELNGWFSYFEQRPVGWREDDRTVKLLQAQGVKEPGHKLFPSLAALSKVSSKSENDETLDINNLKNSVLFNKMLSATGGDKLSI